MVIVPFYSWGNWAWKSQAFANTAPAGELLGIWIQAAWLQNPYLWHQAKYLRKTSINVTPINKIINNKRKQASLRKGGGDNECLHPPHSPEDSCSPGQLAFSGPASCQVERFSQLILRHFKLHVITVYSESPCHCAASPCYSGWFIFRPSALSPSVLVLHSPSLCQFLVISSVLTASAFTSLWLDPKSLFKPYPLSPGPGLHSRLSALYLTLEVGCQHVRSQTHHLLPSYLSTLNFCLSSHSCGPLQRPDDFYANHASWLLPFFYSHYVFLSAPAAFFLEVSLQSAPFQLPGWTFGLDLASWLSQCRSPDLVFFPSHLSEPIFQDPAQRPLSLWSLLKFPRRRPPFPLVNIYSTLYMSAGRRSSYSGLYYYTYTYILPF